MESALHGFSIFTDSGLLVLIWIVQVAVYPAFPHIESKAFKTWHYGYTRKMGYIAGPLMIAQLGAAGLSVYHQPSLASSFYIAAVAGTWAVTFLYSVPLHRALETHGPQPTLIAKLISTNWIRTIIWSAIALRHLV